PDDNHIYYITRPRNEQLNKLYQTPLLGGGHREMMSNVDSPITFSPNGEYFAFVRHTPTLQETSLIIASPKGSEERKLATRKGLEEFSSMGPSWSPDGRAIACPTFMNEQDDFYMQLLAINVEDGSYEPIGSQKWAYIGQVAWLNDGSGVVF